MAKKNTLTQNVTNAVDILHSKYFIKFRTYVLGILCIHLMI